MVIISTVLTYSSKIVINVDSKTSTNKVGDFPSLKGQERRKENGLVNYPVDDSLSEILRSLVCTLGTVCLFMIWS